MRSRTLWYLVWTALAALIVVRATTRPDRRGVLIDHLEFGRRLVEGRDLYADWHSDPDAPARPLHAPYPPSFALLTAPFALLADTLGLRAARAAWALLQVAAITALLWALKRLPTGRSPPSGLAQHWFALAALLVLSRFVLRDTHGGGGNLLNVALCMLGYLCCERGQPARAGWLLAVSLATKPTLVWVLPVFLALGHRRAVAHAVAAGAALVLVSLVLLRFDAAPWLRWLEGSLALAGQADAFAVPALGFPEFEWMNQSLRCATARWLDDVPAPYAARVALGVPPGLGLGTATAAWTARLLCAALLVWLIAAAVSTRRGGGPERTAIVAGTLVLSLLASPLSWKAHHVALLPLLYVLLRRAWTTRSRALWTLLGALFVGCGLGQALLGDDVDELLNSLYVLPLFDLLLLAAALRLPRGEAGPGAGDPAATAVAAPAAPR